MNGNTGDHCHCHFHPDLIVVRRGDEGGAVTLLNDNNIPAVEVDPGPYIDGLGTDEIGTVVETIALLDLDPDDVGGPDPHFSADLLVNGGIDASPVHGLGFLGHSNYKGDDFVPLPGIVPAPVSDSSWDQVIAVVDSGLAPPEDLPTWMGEEAGVLLDRPQDTEVLAFKNPVSHGTFVVSVIRRLAPDFVVSIASARPDPGFLVTDENPHSPSEAQPTDELNVYGALVRLVNRLQDGPSVVALNLSLGAHDCPGGGLFLMTMRIALDHWIANFPEAAIFAAGGNSKCAEPVYPAAFWTDLNHPLPVRAVGAVADRGEPLVWVKGSSEPDLGRDWITDWAPGQRIQGLSGQYVDQVIEWSGSSFSCAVATACYAAGGTSTLDVNTNQTWWPDQTMDYTSIPNLVL